MTDTGGRKSGVRQSRFCDGKFSLGRQEHRSRNPQATHRKQCSWRDGLHRFKLLLTVTLPCILWFLDKGKASTSRKYKILFIDAREIFTQVDRAHREFTGEQIGKLAWIVRNYREEKGSEPYEDVKGLCKVATLDDVREQGYSLNPGRYVGVAEAVEEDFDFTERLQELNEELEGLNLEARELEEEIYVVINN